MLDHSKTAGLPFAEYLHTLAAETELLGREIGALCSGMSTQQFNWQPAPKSWSVGQCVQHLVVFNKLYFTALEKSFAHAKPASGTGIYTPTLFGKFCIRQMYPGKVKLPAPSSFHPLYSELPLAVLDGFDSTQKQLADMIQRSAAYDLNRVRVVSPASSLLRFRLGDALSLILLHERRHLDQMQRVIAAQGFPA